MENKKINRRNFLDLDLISDDAFKKLIKLDINFVGTTNYMGIAYFWHRKYDPILGSIAFELRQELHRIFLFKGLALDETSKMHNQTIKSFLKKHCTSDLFNQFMRCFEFYNLEV